MNPEKRLYKILLKKNQFLKTEKFPAAVNKNNIKNPSEKQSESSRIFIDKEQMKLYYYL